MAVKHTHTQSANTNFKKPIQQRTIPKTSELSSSFSLKSAVDMAACVTSNKRLAVTRPVAPDRSTEINPSDPAAPEGGRDDSSCRSTRRLIPGARLAAGRRKLGQRPPPCFSLLPPDKTSFERRGGRKG